MPEALTNFPNGISTSVVVLSGEGGMANIEGSSDIVVPGINPATTVHSTINLNVPNPATPPAFGAGLFIETDIIGPATATNGAIGIFFRFDAQGAASGATIRPEFSGLSYQFNALATDKFAGNVYGMTLAPLVLGAASALTTARLLYLQGITCDSSIAGSTSATLDIIVPNGSAIGAGTVTNYGININGNGSVTATQNWAIFSSSTAPSYLGGPLIQHPSVSTIPVNNGDLTVSATSNTSVTVRLKGTDGTVRAVVLTLA